MKYVFYLLDYLKFDHIYHLKYQNLIEECLKRQFDIKKSIDCYYSRPKDLTLKTRSFFKSTFVIYGPPGVFATRIYLFSTFYMVL